jgi:hypothetical protein
MKTDLFGRSSEGELFAAQQRFLDKVQFSPESECWVWRAAVSTSGYGVFFVRKVGAKKLTAYAHRAAYELFVGPMPDGLTIDHLCCNRLCVKPSHLQTVTARENIRRRDARKEAQS